LVKKIFTGNLSKKIKFFSPLDKEFGRTVSPKSLSAKANCARANLTYEEGVKCESSVGGRNLIISI